MLFEIARAGRHFEKYRVLVVLDSLDCRAAAVRSPRSSRFGAVDCSRFGTVCWQALSLAPTYIETPRSIRIAAATAVHSAVGQLRDPVSRACLSGSTHVTFARSRAVVSRESRLASRGAALGTRSRSSVRRPFSHHQVPARANSESQYPSPFPPR